MPWTAPSLSVKYGPYFKADVDDQTKLVNAVRAAVGDASPLVTRELAVRALAPMFGVENVAAVLDKLEEEQNERDAKALEKTTAEQQSLHELASGLNGEKPKADRSGGGRQPPGAQGGGSGGAAAADKGKK